MSSNPAIASRLQSNALVGWVAGSLDQVAVSTRFYKVLITGFGLLSAALAVLLARAHFESSRLKADIRFANDITWGFDDDRKIACKGTTTEAADILWKLHFPSFDWQGKPEPFEGALARVVERHRRAAVRAVITCLKTKTGDDLGDDPEPWILKYGSEDARGGLRSMKEAAGQSPANEGSNRQRIEMTGASFQSVVEPAP